MLKNFDFYDNRFSLFIRRKTFKGQFLNELRKVKRNFDYINVFV